MGFGGGLQGSLTGRQNTKFVCRIHGQGHLIPEKIDYVQEFAEIGDAFDEPVKTYSSGMKARLQFALSLAFDFDVSISDEITAVGDAEFKKKAQHAFADLTGKSSQFMMYHGEGPLGKLCATGTWIYEAKQA